MLSFPYQDTNGQATYRNLLVMPTLIEASSIHKRSKVPSSRMRSTIRVPFLAMRCRVMHNECDTIIKPYGSLSPGAIVLSYRR
uniref:AlNc14C171G8016 protein n=1 Tax=Albugo laibachii Nc14 TaxID=890382 RepID=F0WEK1_9STRA|nr:AlNc14C75G5052 [Albugo laibachii Nc14]CCA22883.1 AlNc14C171G8016 [Albugo laibachii Nc14]|eukprot:CCA22883.1 AlNc14C171G8016 [Albugo laibachii Nc14]